VHNKSRKLCKKDVIIEIKKILKEVLDIKWYLLFNKSRW
jgi:hypothetical protein